jgi:putative ABC transport system permease protein
MPEDQMKLVTAIPVDKDFAQTFSLELIAGSDFTEADVMEIEKPENEIRFTYILNEAAVQELGFTPQEAIGQKMILNREGVIRGVVKNFHFESLREHIGPLVIFMEKLWGGKMMVKLSGNDVPGTIRFLESKWKTLAPHRPFEYQFLDEEYNRLYQAEQHIGTIATTFALLAIVLACLGLFGLAAFSTTLRTKEIGIRKVLGASVPEIVLLLSGAFLKLVLVAFVIAAPLAAYAMHQWLADFAYRIEIEWWMFALAGLAALLIAWLTVSYQSIKAALMNPVKSLRSE